MNLRRPVLGFTLLELLIGLALLGMLMVLLFSALRLGSKSSDAGESILSQSNSRAVMTGFLRKSLSQLQPWRFNGEGGQTLAFLGEPESLRFAGILPSQSGHAGLRLIALELSNGRLQLRHRSPTADTKGFEVLDAANAVVLAEGIQSLTMSYFGSEQPDAEASWHPAWSDEARTPRLIRIALVDKSGHAWPEIVAAPMLDGEANCDWDPVRKYCQDPNITGRLIAGPAASKGAP